MTKPGIPLAYGQTKDPYPEEHQQTIGSETLIELEADMLRREATCDHLVLMKPVKVYGASKFARAPMWRRHQSTSLSPGPPWSHQDRWPRQWLHRWCSGRFARKLRLRCQGGPAIADWKPVRAGIVGFP